ncbi:magnesium transporter MRS2-4-like [Papaver somniferum]|uniref:magnesium transporter MRS2-4-like n=1 Tax=Papaver somniferum TaxID=3469 RepID=UPI000E702F8B|nr:magnesium transporter MRS2-4-like [Papaver somniferum]
MGKGSVSFPRKILRRRNKKSTEMQPKQTDHINNFINSNPNNSVGVVPTSSAKPKKKTGNARLWMKFNQFGESEVSELDKSAIIKRVSIPARDLRILGPVFSQSSNILAREKAMVVNLEFIKAIVTAEEVLLLDPLCQEVIPFVEQLKQQLPHNRQPKTHEVGAEAAEGLQSELPFEFQVLEIALEVVCTYLDSNVADLERNAYPVLDELARNVSTKNLELVRSLKSTLTRLLARVQKVRDELEHLLDDNEDMAQLYLTRKFIQNQQSEALMGTMGSNSNVTIGPNLRRLDSNKSASLITSNRFDDHDDVEDLEMLLEAYFMQLDGTRNKILSVREYIDDTEDYVNIQLDNQRNELIQLQLTLTIASFAIAVETLIAGTFGMNIPCLLYRIEGIFGPIVGGSSAGCFLMFLLMLAYARWKKLLGS